MPFLPSVDASNRAPARFGSRLLGGLLMALGAVVFAGWLLRLPVLTQVFPGLTSMVAQTAVDFVLAGLALLLPRRADGGRAVTLLPATLLLLFAGLNLIQIGTGVMLGLNLPALHAWIGDGNPRPGQQSSSSSVSFVVAALSLLALAGLRRPGARMIAAGRASAALLFAIALAALVGYVLRLELLVARYLFSKMALHTAFGLLLLSIALWWRWNALESRDGAEARELRGLVSVSLLLTAVIAALTSVAVFRDEGERALDRSLSMARGSMAEGVQTVLSMRSTRAAIITTRPLLRASLRRLDQMPGDDEARDQSRGHIEGFLGYGFSYIGLVDARGRILAEVGVRAPGGRLILPLSGLPGGQAELQVGSGFLLRHRGPVDTGDGVRGVLITEQPLPELATLLSSERQLGSTARSLLCGSGPVAGCVGAGGELLTGETAPAALQASTVVDHRVERTDIEHRLQSWQRLGDIGLALNLSLDRDELYAPIRMGLLRGFSMVGVLALLALLLVRSRVAPLVARVAHSEGRYHAVVESLSEGVMLIDPDGRVLTANRAGERILGLRAEQTCGRRLAELDLRIFDEAGRQLVADQYPTSRTLASGQQLSGQLLRVQRNDGSERWISVDTALADDNDAPAGTGRSIVASFADITEERRARSESARLEARYRTLVGGIADGVVSIDERGIVHSYNFAAERIFGWPAEQVLGRNVTMLMPERYRGSHDRNVSRFALQQDPTIIGMRRDVTGLRADGREFPMTLALNVVPGGGAARFVALVTDISERRRAERDLQEASRLRQAILDNAPFIVIATDVEGRITTFNPAAERMLWYRTEDMIGQQPTPFWDPIEVSQRAAEIGAETGRPIEPGFEVFIHRARHGQHEEREWTLVRRDGSRFLANVAVNALRDGAGEINGFLGIAYDITERKRREDYTQHVAHHDALTGLPNRLLLNDRLTVALDAVRRHRGRMAVMMVDLDHFKRINDSMGHHVGDLLLVEVARRLKHALRASDTVARLGGDEFVLLLPELDEEPESLTRLAAKIVAAVGAPMNLHGHELEVTPSIGIAVFPDDGDHADTLLKHADAALYRAKAQGRNGYQLFSRDLAHQADQRMALEAALRRALKREEFRLHYQPQVDLDSGEVIGMEALLRWTDPLLGPVSPATFIPVAEECGVILPLGDWVLRTAMLEAVAIRQRCGRPLRLAVNLSPRQFRQGDLVERVASALAASGLPATALELEITEGALMVDTAETQTRLKTLRALGVAIAIDDFGVGFSSLSYVTRFEIDTLKIDRSFIAALPDSASDAAVAQTVIALGQALGIKVVAEGVETDAQLGFLRAHRCPLAQGARFGMPDAPGAFSVQGFRFGAALAPEAFVAALPARP
jgi:diguanylate cyclase (GGDEF)-like protein/PAS domain S-box-containing protein